MFGKKLNYIPSWLDGTTTLLQKLNRCIERVEELASSDITQVNSRLNALEPKVAQCEDDIDGLFRDDVIQDDRLDGIDGRIDGVEERINDVDDEIVTLKAVVGDNDDGLVKDVADLGTAVGGLETTVGDSNGGLVKDVADLGTAVGGLETTVGDSNGGLVKDVADLGTAVGGKQGQLYEHFVLFSFIETEERNGETVTVRNCNVHAIIIKEDANPINSFSTFINAVGNRGVLINGYFANIDNVLTSVFMFSRSAYIESDEIKISCYDTNCAEKVESITALQSAGLTINDARIVAL